MISVILALIFAILSPIIYAAMNVIDKYVLAHKVKVTLSWAAVAGVVSLLFGVILALFLKWDGITLKALLFPASAGTLIGFSFFLYYLTMKEEDASHVTGLIYTYPVLVAILSFVFLGEVISVVSYIGMALTLLGVIMLSVRIKKIKVKASIWMIALMILIVALNEFFIKVATTNISALNGTAVNMIFMGIVASSILFNGKIRKGFAYELKNVRFSFLGVTMSLLGLLTLYLAMTALPATIVSSVAAIQPLIVLFFERIAHKKLGKITRDTEILPKLIPICLIVIGVILLYAPEIIKALG